MSDVVPVLSRNLGATHHQHTHSSRSSMMGAVQRLAPRLLLDKPLQSLHSQWSNTHIGFLHGKRIVDVANSCCFTQMTSPGQIIQKRIHDTLHAAKLPNEILFGRFQSDGSSPIAAEQPGWRRLSPDQFWLLVQRLATSTNVTRFEFSGNAVGPRRSQL
jgi:hypothetical protein